MKKIISIALTLIVVIGSAITPALATNITDGNEITYDQFCNALRTEYAKYGILFEMENIREGSVYTQDLLDYELRCAKDVANNISVELVGVSSHMSSAGGLRTMPVDGYLSYQWIVTSSSKLVPGEVTFETYSILKLDLQNNYIISASDAKTVEMTDLIQINYAGNTLTTSSRIVDSTALNVSVRGNVSFSRSLPSGDSYSIAVPADWGQRFEYDSFTHF